MRAMLKRATAGDLVVLCVDDPVAVYRETMNSRRRSGRGPAFHDPGRAERARGLGVDRASATVRRWWGRG